eukprot:gene11942-13917_t
MCDSLLLSAGLPATIDLKHTATLWKFSCFGLLVSNDRIQSYIPGPDLCDLGGNQSKEMVNLWNYAPRCLHGSLVVGSTNSTNKCTCQDGWHGDACDQPRCQDGYVFSNSTESCQCAKDYARVESVLQSYQIASMSLFPYVQVLLHTSALMASVVVTHQSVNILSQTMVLVNQVLVYVVLLPATQSAQQTVHVQMAPVVHLVLSTMDVHPVFPFNVPMVVLTQITIPFGVQNNLTVADITGNPIALIGIIIPPVTDTIINGIPASNMTLITIKPVADSYLRTIKFDDPEATLENTVFTPVINITVSSQKEDEKFAYLVELSFKVNLTQVAEIIGMEPEEQGWETPNMNKTLAKLCLAFINVSTNTWECVNNGAKRFNRLMLLDDNTVLGYTTHFTSFAILLRPPPPSYSGEEGYYGDYSQPPIVSRKVMLITVFVIIGCVVVLTMCAVAYFSHRRYGSFKTMKQVWGERLKYNIKTIGRRNPNQPKSTPSSPPMDPQAASPVEDSNVVVGGIE